MPNLLHRASDYRRSTDDALFARIAIDIENQGYSINPDALSDRLAQNLSHHLYQMMNEGFKPAGTGRAEKYSQSECIHSFLCFFER